MSDDEYYDYGDDDRYGYGDEDNYGNDYGDENDYGGYDYGEEDYGQDDVKFEQSVNAFEHMSSSLVALLTDQTGKNTNPVDRFIIAVDAICRKNMDKLKLSEVDIATMLNTAVGLKDIQYKNPYGFIIGFVASNGGFNYDNMDNAFKINDKIAFAVSPGVYKEDIVRYARYWNNLQQLGLIQM